ncbi:MAG: hypothetical protein EBZ48_16340, partial [Proteobacteria bacterium]|nr:hypothetical protein [Pseudomonadota bacterium]
AVLAAFGWSDIDLEYGFYDSKFGERFGILPGKHEAIIQKLFELNLSRAKLRVEAGGKIQKSKMRDAASSRQESLF